MLKKEGEILKNRLKGTGKKMPEIALILGMTRQNLNYHLRKDKLDNDFKRLLKEKEKFIFHLENIHEKIQIEDGDTFQRLIKLLEQNAETINSQQKTIQLLAAREQPPDIGTAKNV